MNDPSEGWRCSQCGFDLYYPVSRGEALAVSHLGLYDDARFPGRCVLAFHRHEESLEALSDTDRDALWTDATVVARAIKRATGCARVNYAVLGNAEPHLHIHLVPRQPAAEPLPTRPPWNDPRAPEEMGGAELRHLRSKLERSLQGA